MNFKDTIAQKKLVLVDFWAPWCRYCIILEPTLEALSNKFGDKLDIFKVNVDDNPEIAQEYGVLALPTLRFFFDGKEIAEVSDRSEEALEQQMSDLLSKY